MMSIVPQCVDFALLMISIVINALYCITYDKHSYAIHWDYIANECIIMKCIGIALFMICIVVQW